MRQDRHPRGQGGQRQDLRSHRQHDLLGIGEDPDGDSESPQQEQLLNRGEIEKSADAKIREGRDGDEDADHIGDIVRAEAVRPESADNDQREARVGIEPQEVNARRLEKYRHQVQQGGGDQPREHRANHPGPDDLEENPRVRDRLAEQVPADDGADDGLRGRDGHARPGHPVDGEAGRGRGRERAGQRVDRAEIAKGLGGPTATDDRAQYDEDAGDEGRGAKADDPAADGGAEHIGRVVRAERPAQEQATRQE